MSGQKLTRRNCLILGIAFAIFIMHPKTFSDIFSTCRIEAVYDSHHPHTKKSIQMKLTKPSISSHFISVVACVFIATPSLNAQSKTLYSFDGAIVGVWDGNIDSDTVTNAKTGDLADGSDLAKITRPGLIQIVDSDFALITELTSNGEQLGQDELGRLVSNFDVLTDDGSLFLPGESLPSGLTITSGLIKNPGPEHIELSVVTVTGHRNYILEAGDALFVGSIDEALAIAASGTFVEGCLCTCRKGSNTEEIDAHCPGCEDGDSVDHDGPPIDIDDVPTDDGCCCERLHMLPCRMTVGTQKVRGVTENCVKGLIPQF